MSVTYYSYLEAQLSDTPGPSIDWGLANANFYIAKSRVDFPAAQATMRAALETYANEPTANAAEKLGQSLMMRVWSRWGPELSGLHNLYRDMSLNTSTLVQLRAIAESTSNRVTFINAVSWLLASGHELDQKFLCVAAFEEELADTIWQLGNFPATSGSPQDLLIIALAKAGTFDAQEWLCNQANQHPPEEIRRQALRYGFSEAHPEAIELYGEPNPDFTPALVRFINDFGLIEELKAPTIDIPLRQAALTICSDGICSSLLDGTEPEYFRQSFAFDSMFSLLIEHLREQPLSLNELLDLALVYDVLFEEVDRRLGEDPNKPIHHSQLIIDKKEHRQLAKKIRGIFDVNPNRQILDDRVKSGGVDGRNAMLTLNRIYPPTAEDRQREFDALLDQLQRAFAAGANQFDVPMTGFTELVKLAKGDASKVAKVIEWCEDYCEFMLPYSALSVNLQLVLHNSLELLRDNPGIRSELLRTGIESTTHCDRATEILLSRPRETWPENIEQSLQTAQRTSENRLELLSNAIAKLDSDK